MKCVILQPSYIPWRGFFHLIQKADVFVFYDDVQYDHRGWRNRNRIAGPQGSQWLTIPVRHKGAIINQIPINEIRIDSESDWNKKHCSSLRHVYRRTPHFDRYWPLVESFYLDTPKLLADFTIETTIALARELGLEQTRFLRASDLPSNGQKTDRLLCILRHLGADHYISGPSAKDYLEEEKFQASGITLEYMEYDYPEYPQVQQTFDPHLSILDLLFMVGPEAHRYIWSQSSEPALAGLSPQVWSSSSRVGQEIEN